MDDANQPHFLVWQYAEEAKRIMNKKGVKFEGTFNCYLNIDVNECFIKGQQTKFHWDQLPLEFIEFLLAFSDTGPNALLRGLVVTDEPWNVSAGHDSFKQHHPQDLKSALQSIAPGRAGIM